MRLLLDQNLPQTLLRTLGRSLPGSDHVIGLGLHDSPTVRSTNSRESVEHLNHARTKLNRDVQSHPGFPRLSSTLLLDQQTSAILSCQPKKSMLQPRHVMRYAYSRNSLWRERWRQVQ